MCLILLTWVGGITLWVNPDYIKTVKPRNPEKGSEVILHGGVMSSSYSIEESAQCVMYKARYCKDLNPNIVPDVCKKGG